MGNIVKICKDRENDSGIQQILMENEELKRQLKMNKNILMNVRSTHASIKAHVDRVYYAFKEPTALADEIMKTEIHKKWMDDDVEKRYLVDVLEYVQKKITYIPEL